MLHEELTGKIISAAHEVHNELGFGFLEAVYGNALYKELTYRGLKCECQKKVDVFYKSEKVGLYIPDMIVEDTVIIELKATKDFHLENEWQLLNYLKACHLEVGLLINFGMSLQVRRKILTHVRSNVPYTGIKPDKDE